MLVCFRNSDNRIIGSQSSGALSKLIANAVTDGYTAGDVRAEIVDDLTFANLLKAQNLVDNPKRLFLPTCLGRMTDLELIALYTLARTSAKALRMIEDLRGGMDHNSPEIAVIKTAAVTAGVFVNAARADVVFAAP